MNFLALVNEVARESGTMGGQTLGTVTGASGRWLKVVRWTSQAWEMIQRDRTDWKFLRKTFTASLVIGQARYSAAELAIAGFGGWPRYTSDRTTFTLHDPAIGRGDEVKLFRMEYDRWASIYDIGVPGNNRPVDYSFDDDRQFCIGNPPDKAYVVRGHYRRLIQTLTADGDEPYISSELHAIIVWRALMLLGDDDEAPFEVASSGQQYRILREALISEYTEEVTL